MEHFAVSAVGRDRPGIVAALAAALLELDGNIEDSRMAILGGHFSVMLVVSLPTDGREVELRDRLERAGVEVGLDAVAVNPLDETPPAAGPSHVISVYGADHPGIVHAVSSRLATSATNITDLQTSLVGSEQTPVYVMLLEVELDPGAVGALDRSLDEVRAEANVDITINALETEAL